MWNKLNICRIKYEISNESTNNEGVESTEARNNDEKTEVELSKGTIIIHS